MKASQRTKIRLELLGQHPYCHYCNRPLTRRRATIDHVVPLASGGKDTRDNYVLCCQRCNRMKGTMTEAEWKQILDDHKRKGHLLW
jgi:5-methylcytosine-specific restriction endonuclease McrA